MKMIVVNQSRITRIAPAFGIEMQAKDEIRMQLRVHEHRAAPDLAVTGKQHVTLPPDRLIFLRIVWIENIRTRLRKSVLDQNISGELLEIARPLRSNRLSAG